MHLFQSATSFDITIILITIVQVALIISPSSSFSDSESDDKEQATLEHEMPQTTEYAIDE